MPVINTTKEVCEAQPGNLDLNGGVKVQQVAGNTVNEARKHA